MPCTLRVIFLVDVLQKFGVGRGITVHLCYASASYLHQGYDSLIMFPPHVFVHELVGQVIWYRNRGPEARAVTPGR